MPPSPPPPVSPFLPLVPPPPPDGCVARRSSEGKARQHALGALLEQPSVAARAAPARIPNRRGGAPDLGLGAAVGQCKDGVDFKISIVLAKETAQSAQACDVDEVGVPPSRGDGVGKIELKRVRHDRHLADTKSPTLPESRLHLAQRHRGDLQVAQTATGLANATDRQLPHAIVWRCEEACFSAVPPDLAATVKVASVVVAADREAGALHGKPGVVVCAEVAGSESPNVLAMDAGIDENLDPIREHRSLLVDRIGGDVVWHRWLAAAPKRRSLQHRVHVELDVMSAPAEGRADFAQSRHAKVLCPDGLDEESSNVPLRLQQAHDEADAQFLPLVVEAPPHLDVVTDWRLDSASNQALLGALYVHSQIDTHLGGGHRLE